MSRLLRIVLLGAVAAHAGWRLGETIRPPGAGDIPPAPSTAALRTISLGDPIALAQGIALFLQGADREDGTSTPLALLDYDRAEAWLARMLDLDPASGYALMLATHVYAQAADSAKQRRMLDFAHRAYESDPTHRWRWLAHASLIARHRLADLELALRYASALSTTAGREGVPGWALQLPALIAEERGEYESARIYVGGLLASGQVTDPREVRFLTSEIARLAEIDADSAPSTK